ncbi:MAG: hypothetical protein AAB067_00875 [Planctomycetota bacterium]
MKKHEIELTKYEFNTLKNNSIINAIFSTLLLNSIETKNGNKYLYLTLAELNELTGFVAAEANHAKTPKQEEALGALYEYLDGIEYKIKRNL